MANQTDHQFHLQYNPCFLLHLLERHKVLRKTYPGQILEACTIWGRDFWHQHSAKEQTDLSNILAALSALPLLPLEKIESGKQKGSYRVFGLEEDRTICMDPEDFDF
jgi:hypothetical protein